MFSPFCSEQNALSNNINYLDISFIEIIKMTNMTERQSNLEKQLSALDLA